MASCISRCCAARRLALISLNALRHGHRLGAAAHAAAPATGCRRRCRAAARRCRAAGWLTRRLKTSPPASARPNTTRPPARNAIAQRVDELTASAASRPAAPGGPALSAARSGEQRERCRRRMRSAPIASELGQHAERAVAARSDERSVVAVGSRSRQARRRNPAPGQQHHLAVRQPRQFLGQVVGQLVADRQRAEHLVGKARRHGHRPDRARRRGETTRGARVPRRAWPQSRQHSAAGARLGRRPPRDCQPAARARR